MSDLHRQSGGEMGERVQYLTAQTERGRAGLEEVMQHSYAADIQGVPPEWARVRVMDEVPVSFIIVDPNKQMEFPGGEVRFAFIGDVATREDRRGEGHFRSIMEDTFSSLRAAGIAVVVTHGRYQLYRGFGFEVFTHHSGIFVTPQSIERTLGVDSSKEAAKLLVIEDRQAVKEDLLLITQVKADSPAGCKAALQAAAALALERDKARILFEYPPAPSYGSRYPIYETLETRFVALARTCGAEVRVQGADPEGGAIPDADWIRVLDAAGFVTQALGCLEGQKEGLPEGAICFDTDAGAVTIESSGDGVVTWPEVRPDAPIVKWPSSALAQLVTGYRSAEVLSAIQGTALSPEVTVLLNGLFPRCWRLSRNESWAFRA